VFVDSFHGFLVRVKYNKEPRKSKEKVEGSGMVVVTPHWLSSKGVSDWIFSCQLPLTFSPKKASIGAIKTGEVVGV
jgi:hypothetical protein